jgi:DUF2075 family protein
MPAYSRHSIRSFLTISPAEVVGVLQQRYAADGFASQYTRQTRAWGEVIPSLKDLLRRLVACREDAYEWAILVEYPLYRLRRRIDLVILAGDTIVVVECKVGADQFSAQDRRQVEEYALDLRDFHGASSRRRIVPLLWSTDAEPTTHLSPQISDCDISVVPVVCVGTEGFERYLATLQYSGDKDHIVAEAWDGAPYRPVPGVIEAATIIFAGHGVKSIANADADNLSVTASRLVALIREARECRKRYLLLLTGVPGSGKTLAGLNVVHTAIETGVEKKGDIVYLSGNTPLVVVIREALARDEHRRGILKRPRRSLDDIRRDVRVRVQHINDFLQQCLIGAPEEPPEEHVIVFDEAQRAWDAKQGQEKFNRTASEPLLLLELMSRHRDWCACVCLIGSGQEINSGEEGVRGWGDALRNLDPRLRREWTMFAAPDVFSDAPSTRSIVLSELPAEIATRVEPDLQLRVPQRSYRSPKVSKWVDQVLAGDEAAAASTALDLGEYPIVFTRSLAKAKAWLQKNSRGKRRFGLVASSGARRMRADGLGMSLHASAGTEIAHWYLNPRADIRSSFALEVPANEYTCQGLELDLVCLCWGGELLWDKARCAWSYFRLSGTAWQTVRELSARQFVENSYRVLLTRAREGLILWVPEGDDADPTRAPSPLNETADFLESCGAAEVDNAD